MIYIIDGTGPMSNEAYRRDMDRGFCWRIAKQNNGFYLRGPSNDGWNTFDLGRSLVGKIATNRASFVKAPSINNIVGYSRGGAACIYAAYMLKNLGIEVNSMLLFDAVDRTIQPTLFYNLDFIPSNVKRCLHLIRSEPFSYFFHHTAEYKKLKKSQSEEKNIQSSKDEKSDLYARTHLVNTSSMVVGKYSVERPKSITELALQELEDCHVGLRNACRFEVLLDIPEFGVKNFGSFGNTGLKGEPGVSLELVPITATHGAMGGAPLKVSDYIPHEKYRNVIEYSEREAMRKIETMANCFLRLVGESGIPNL